MTTPTLWAVHIAGPDSIIAAESREEAETRVADATAYLAEHPVGVPVAFSVIPWPFSPETHAAACKNPNRWEDA